MFDEILSDIRTGTARAKRFGPVLLGGGVVVGPLAWLLLTEGLLPDLLMGLSSFAVVIGAILIYRSRGPAEKGWLYQQLVHDPQAIVRVRPIHIHRNGVHYNTTLEFYSAGGLLGTTRLPVGQAERWVAVLRKGLPTLVVG